MKKFIWCERVNTRVTAVQGPHKEDWKKIIGFKYIHTLEDLNKLPISEVLKYRLDTAAEGVIIGMHHIHSNIDLAIRRLSEHEISAIQEEKTLRNNLVEVIALIEKKEPVLHMQKKNIEKQLNIVQQKIKEMNLEGADL
jgi:hypothetical protein